jgi:precorrin-6B methylase 1
VLVKRVWIDREPEVNFDPSVSSVDVLVEMEDGKLWQARFVTLGHLKSELALSLEVAHEHNRALAPTPFLALETPHVVAENLNQDTIEDVVDNLLVLGVFESVFATFKPESEPTGL